MIQQPQEFSSTNPQEVERLKSIYECLRERLLDMSLRNPMLNYRSNRQLKIIDEVPESIYRSLVDGTQFEVIPIPEPTKRRLDKLEPEGKEKISLVEQAEILGLDPSLILPSSPIKSVHSDKKIASVTFVL